MLMIFAIYGDKLFIIPKINAKSGVNGRAKTKKTHTNQCHARRRYVQSGNPRGAEKISERLLILLETNNFYLYLLNLTNTIIH